MRVVNQVELTIAVRRFLRDHAGERVEEIARAADLRDRFRLAKSYSSQGDHALAACEYRWCFQNRIKGREPHPFRYLRGWARARLKQLRD